MFQNGRLGMKWMLNQVIRISILQWFIDHWWWHDDYFSHFLPFQSRKLFDHGLKKKVNNNPLPFVMGLTISTIDIWKSKDDGDGRKFLWAKLLSFLFNSSRKTLLTLRSSKILFSKPRSCGIMQGTRVTTSWWIREKSKQN